MSAINSKLGGPGGYGDGVFSSTPKVVGNNDDGSVELKIASVFGTQGAEFFGESYDSLFINSNGLISFGAADTSYTGSSLSDLSHPSIALFWSDHNIGAKGEIYWDVDPDAGTVTITWDDAAAYNGDIGNTYQLVLSKTGDGEMDVEFIYDDIGWHQSGGNSAITGITDGENSHYPLDGSGRPEELNKYHEKEFEDGEDKGTYTVSFKDGMPQFQDQIVDGTDGDDKFLLSVLDVDGDGVSTGADNILTNGGDDYVDADDGDDTVHGGSGSDTILGGDGADHIYGDGVSGGETAQTTSINASNFNASNAGYKVTARNIENGNLSEASVDNIASTMGGFGAGGRISDSDSGVTQQTGFDLASGNSEQLIVEFDAPISDASFSFMVLYTSSYGEQAQYTLYKDGKEVAQSTFTEDSAGSGSGTIDLSGHGEFDTIVFTGLAQTDRSDGSDFLLTDITFTPPIRAEGYNDSLSGGDGVDSIFGGQGDDTISGDGGADTIFGEDGHDKITAGVGDDSVLGGSGNDSISGGDGNDYIEGGEGDDLLRTGLGDDTLIGGLGNDTLENSDGDDSLDGGAGNDSIVATGGEDTLRGGTGDDTMGGGNDADTFIIEDGFGNDVITGGEGTTDGTDSDYDTIDLSAVSGPVTVTFTGAEEGTITDGTDTITFTEIERIITTDQNDSVDGTSVYNGVFGDRPGIDVETRGGDDTVNGGWGGDTIDGGTGNDLIDGDYGDDTIIGGDGNDTLIGGRGNDTLEGGIGDDSLDAGIEGDNLDGGSGNDTLQGGSGNDTLLGGSGQDTLEGGADNDILDGGSDNDLLRGEDGADTMLGQSGNDTLEGGDGNDLLFGHSGTDTLDGGTGDDLLNGGADNDSLQGGVGDDTLVGGSGDDSISGGDGDDVFVYGVGDGADTITDFNFGNSGALNDSDTANNDFINLGGFYDSLKELREDFADDGVLNQSNSTDNGGTVDYSDNDKFQTGDSLTFQGASETSFTADNTGVMCFAAGTAIRTPQGNVPIERLRPGDLVQTMDNGPQPVRWIGRTELGHETLLANPHLRPVLIKRGVMGTNRDLLVSPQHAMLFQRRHLVRAKHLAENFPGIRVAHGKRQVIYIHLMFETHQIIFAENSPSESFYPGAMALRMMDQTSRLSLLRAFPQLQHVTSTEALEAAYGPTARTFAKASDIAVLRKKKSKPKSKTEQWRPITPSTDLLPAAVGSLRQSQGVPAAQEHAHSASVQFSREQIRGDTVKMTTSSR